MKQFMVVSKIGDKQEAKFYDYMSQVDERVSKVEDEGGDYEVYEYSEPIRNLVGAYEFLYS